MTRSRRLVLFAITFLPVAVLIAVSVMHLRYQIDWLAAHANVIIEGELEHRFGKQVRVGDVQAGTLGIAVFKDVRVAKGKTLRDGTLASAARITVRYDWRALVLGGQGAGSASEVTVADPKVLLIRRRDGTFNITELLKPPPGPRRPPFRGIVKITGGEATFLDYSVRPGEQPTPIRVHDVVGSIRAAAQPVYKFDGTARGTRGHFDRAVFSGDYHAITKRAMILARAGGVAASELAPYVWKSNKIQVLGGKLDTDASLDVRHANGRYSVSVAGTARVNNAAVQLSLFRSPATNINGTVVVSANRAGAKLTGIFAGAPVRASGTLTDLRNPVVDLVVDSAGIEASRVIASAKFLGALSQFSPSGRGPAHAKLTGLLSNLTVETTARVPRASIRGVPVENVVVSATYHQGRVDVRSVELLAKGAIVHASGSVTTGPVTSLDLRGRFENLALGVIPIKTDYTVTGKASGTFSLTGPATNPDVTVMARAENGAVGGVSFSSIDGDVEMAGSRAKIKDLNVHGVFAGSIRASGVASASSFDLNVVAESIDINQLARMLGQPGYAGTAFLNGHVTGTQRSPRIEGSLEVFQGRTKDYSIDHALVAFTADRNRIAVSQGIAQVFPAEVQFSGDATGLSTNRVSIAGKANVKRLEVTKLLELFKRDLDVTGTVVGDDFTFSGAYLPKARPGTPRFVDIVASGSVTVEDATAFGYPVSVASAKLGYAGNTLKLSDASIISDNARLAIDGTVATDTHVVDGRFSLAGFDLSRLQEYTGDYVVLAGVASTSGGISGQWDDLKAFASAKVDGLSVNYEKFDRAELKFDYGDGKLASYSAAIARSGQSLEFSGADFDPDTNCLASAKGVLTDISVPDILDIVRASPFFSSKDGVPIARTIDKFPKLTGGLLNGSFDLTGCMESPQGGFALPDGKIDLTMTNVGVDVQQIQSIDLHASAKSGVVTLSKFLAVSDDTSLEASGDRAYEDGNLRVELKAENVKLSRLSPWLGPKAPDGTLSALFNIEGAWDSPDVIGSVEVIKPSYAGVSFDRLRASQVQITANRVEIPDILLSAQGHQAVAKASVPWDWSSLSIPNDEPISVSAELSKQSLNAVSVLLPVIEAAKTTGTVDAAWFRLNGTLLDPQLAGALKVTGGTIALTDFTNTFPDVNVDLGFTGDRIVVNALSASSSQGGSVHVVPGGYVTVGILGTSEANLRIVADHLTVGEKNLLRLKEDVVTQIDAGLSVLGTPTDPTLADAAVEGKQGGITFSHAKLAFQTTSKRGEWPVLVSVNPKLNVSVRLGQDVVITPPSMQLTVTGGGVLTGTLLQPNIAGLGMSIVSGEINLATARLRVMKGGTIRVSYAPPASPVVRVDLQATASVFAVNSLRQRQRYQISMRVTGQAANPQVDLTSNPPGLNREQMLAALGHVPALFASAEAGLQSELANVLTAAAASTLFAPIENIFVEKLGFEQFSLEYSAMAPLSIYISHQLAGRFYLAFYRRLSASLASVHDVQYEVMLSYRLNPAFQFSFGIDDQQTSTFQFGYAKAFR